uniref:Conotoxin superfamily W n=1 Tax=Conus ermineus TaxID=55423 RepID=A0A346CIK5_CONER|nr:conotoxin precursor superfamily W [Conus ermineus]
MVTSISMSSPRLWPWFGSVGVTGIGESMGAVVGRTWWRPPEGELTHAGSATKQLLSSVGGLVGGVLRMLDQNRRH